MDADVLVRVGNFLKTFLQSIIVRVAQVLAARTCKPADHGVAH
jgi:hypothetical protein